MLITPSNIFSDQLIRFAKAFLTLERLTRLEKSRELTIAEMFELGFAFASVVEHGSNVITSFIQNINERNTEARH